MIFSTFPRPFEDFQQPYRWIVADPPWPYRNKNTGGSMTSGSAAQYDVMTLDEILNLPVPEIAAKDSCIFLWTTTPLLPQGLAVLDRWGFEFKSALYWDKKNYPLGFWFRGRVEPCLIGIRGKVKAFRSSAVNLIQDNWPFREAFDFVFCRNVMIYFDATTQRRVLERIHRNMKPGGMLFVGHAENFTDAKTLFTLRGKTVYERV